MRRSQGGWHGQDGELDEWSSDAHGVAEVAKSLVRSQGGTKEEYDELDAWFSEAHGVAEVARELAQSQGGFNGEPGRHPAHDKV